MARNVATFVVDVVTKNLKAARLEVDSLGKGAQNATSGYNKANQAAGGFYNTQAKGVIGTANSTRSFSKLAETMNQGGGGIVGAYATLAANIFAVTAAFNALRGAAQVQQLQAGLEAMGNRMGTTLSVAAENVREISGYTLTVEQSLRSTAQIASAGFGTKSMTDLAKVANDVSVALGRNMTDSMDRLTRGVVKLEPELLDELGLMTKIGESSSKYARELGKSETQLSNFEKRQGFLNAILAEGQTKFGGLADSAGNTRNLDLLAATFADLTKEILNFVNNGALPLAAIFSNKGVLLGGMILFASTISKQLLPGLSNLSVKTAKSAQDLTAVAKQRFQDIPTGPTEPRPVKALRRAIDDGKATDETYVKALKSISVEEAKLTQEIAAGSSKRAKYKKFTISQLEDEHEILQDQKKIVTETQLLQQQAVAKTTGANAILAAGQRKVVVSYMLTKQAVIQYKTSLDQAAAAQGRLGLVTQTLNGIRAGFFGAAIAARAFGAAITSALGIIGGIIAAGALLYGAYEFLRDWFTSKETKAYNEALKEQEEIIGKLDERYKEMKRARDSTVPIAQREQAVYKIMTNTIRENIEAYEKVKVAQDALYKDRKTVAIGDTAEFDTLKKLRASGAPEVKRQIDEALGKQGLTGILENAKKEIDKDTLGKLAKVLSVDLRQGAVTLGDHINDLAEAFKNADSAIADFNRSAIPSTPYDNVVTQIDSVAQALANISTNAATSQDYIGRMANAIQAAGPNMQKFFTPDTQGLINQAEELDLVIQKAGDNATKQDLAKKRDLTEILALRSSEIYEVQELFATAQRVARETEGLIKLEQVRLDKLNSYTALTGSSLRERRASENKILQLQASQIQAQANIVKTQMEMNRIQLETNTILLQTDTLYQQIAASIALGGEMTGANLQTQLNSRLVDLQKERDTRRGGVFGGRNDEAIEKDVQAIIALQGKYATMKGMQVQIQAQQDQINAANAESTAILAKQTSATIVNAEASALNAQTTAANTQKRVENQQQLLKNERILSDIEVKRRGRARSTAEEYALIVTEQAKITVMQQEAIANAANAEVQEMRVQQARAAGNAQEVAAYQIRIDSTIKLANAKMTEIDLQNRLNILDKFSFDIHKEGLEMQRDSLNYMEKQMSAQNEYNALQREGRILTAEVARKRGGRASNEFSKRSDDIAEARAQLNMAKEQAGMRKAVINLEYALLDAQRQQMVWNLTAQQKILGETSLQGQQLGAVIQRLQEGAEAVQAGQEAALASVDQNISNLTKKLQSAGLKEGGNFVGSGLRDLIKSQQDAARAARTPDSKPIEALKTVVHPLEVSNQALANMQGDLTSATRDLTAQLRSMADGPLPKLTEAVTKGTLDDAAQIAMRGGLKVSENDAYGWQVRGRKASDRQGHSRNSAHYRNAAIDINAPGVGNESLSKVWGPRFDALANQFREMGFKVLWKTKDHYDHMHVEMTDRVRKNAEKLGISVAQMVEIPLKAATDTIKAAEEALPNATTPTSPPPAANNNDIVVNGRRRAETPRDIGSLTEQFANITQAGDFNMLEVFENMADKLGPEGTIVTTIMSGITQIGGAISNFQAVMNDPKASFGDKFAAGATVMQSALGTIQGVLSAASDAKIAGIDREIAAEQRRDGKSVESVAKIQALEAKKDAIARKSFNTNKKLMMAQAVIATAAGVAQALTLGPIVGPIMAAVIGALGAAQLAIISGTSYQSSAGANFDQKSMPSTLTIGKRGDGVDLAKNNPNVGGELGYLRGRQGTGTNSSNYAVIGSAYGGPLPRGYGHTAFAVGEKGPEIIEPGMPMNVRPLNDNTQSAPVNATFQIQAFDGASVQEMLHDKRGDIIDMLREAANANGSRFLEDVNTSHYKKSNSKRASRM